MKTQDNKTIFIELGDEGWKFSCENMIVVYISVRKIYILKTNIFISGISNNQQNILS